MLKKIFIWSTVVMVSAFVGAVAQTAVILTTPRLGKLMQEAIEELLPNNSVR